MKIAVLGGSFNPVHMGHLFVADAVLSLGYDRVVLVPAYRSPFKLQTGGDSRARLEMVAASIAGDPRLALDDCEIRRGGVSFTADTLADIVRRYAPEGRPALVIGDDLVEDFGDWHRSGEILDTADVIVAGRTRDRGLSVPFPCVRLANDTADISSGMVRDRIRGGGPWRYLVPQGAREVIERLGLYGMPPASGNPAAASGNPVAASGKQAEASGNPAEASGKAPPPVYGGWPWGSRACNVTVRVEEAVRESMGFERFLHSRATALLAFDLCRRFGLDPGRGYLAGIAHDLAKTLGDKEQIRLAKKYGGGEIPPLEREKPSLLHGRSGAALLREHFGVDDAEVLEAVALHTLGGARMGPLAKAVYVADKLEVTREKIDAAWRRQVLSGGSLDGIFAAVLERNVASLSSRKLRLSEQTLGLLESIRADGDAGDGADLNK